MQILAQTGAMIVPASPSFYSHPQTIEELAMTVVDRILQSAGLEKESYRWGDGNTVTPYLLNNAKLSV
jgi:4-hydroxy-3-polyprenylbenzoate decarboxylase